MTTRNQTQLGFAQQKTGARRTLHSKHAKAVTGVDRNADAEAAENKAASPPSPEELLIERAGNLARTVEQKLATYRKEKEERPTRDNDEAIEERSSRSRTSGQEQKKNDTVAQRTLRSASKSNTTTKKTQTLIDFQRIGTKKKDTGDSEDSATDQAKKVAETLMEEENEKVAEEMSEETTEVTAPEIQKGSEDENTSLMTAAEASKDSAASMEPSQSTAQMGAGKPIAEDTIIHNNGSHSDSDDNGEDNIHPLARKVVKALPRTRKAHIEEFSSIHHKVEVRKSFSIPSMISRKPTVQEPTFQTPLPLPRHMSALWANFKGLETVLVFTKRQGQLCFYHRLKKHVELQSSRNFEIKHLAQFKTLLPEGYKFMAAPCLFEGVKTRSILIEMLELQDETEGNFIPQADKRSKLFMDRLYDHIRQHHQKFITSTTPPRTDTYPHHWHPDFDLESVPTIDEAEMPLLMPAVIDASNLNLRDLGSRRDIPRRTNEESESTTSSPVAEKKPVATATETTDVALNSPGTNALSRLEQLKERIRQKQLAKKESVQGLATREEKHQALVTSRLPSVFDLIRFKRVDVTPLKTLTAVVVKSSRMPISEVEGTESLEMLAETLPEWCNIFSLSDGGRYFKVLRDDGKGGKIEHDERALRSRLVAMSTKQ